MNNSEFRVPSSEFRGRRPGAFTLIELLAVIAMIGILAGLLLASANAARKKVHIAQARTEAGELAKAWKSYWLIYGKWPAGYETVVGGRQMDGNAMRILQGGDGTYNPQGIKFLDLDSDVTTYGFKDPWGELYRVSFDENISPGKDYYETTVYFPNRKRFEYE